MVVVLHEKHGCGSTLWLTAVCALKDILVCSAGRNLVRKSKGLLLVGTFRSQTTPGETKSWVYRHCCRVCLVARLTLSPDTIELLAVPSVHSGVAIGLDVAPSWELQHAQCFGRARTQTVKLCSAASPRDNATVD